MTTYKVLSIDVGIIHLGVSVFKVDQHFCSNTLEHFDLINITKFTHKHVSKNDCDLYHNKTISDWMEHVFQDNLYFYESDYILIERQPPQGHTAVEQIIFNKFRNKVVLISPNSVHKYLGISHLDYDSRKNESEYVLYQTLDDNCIPYNTLESFDRLHDIGDSICMFLYWIHCERKELYLNKKRQRFKTRISTYDKNKTISEWFDTYKYIEK